MINENLEMRFGGPLEMRRGASESTRPEVVTLVGYAAIYSERTNICDCFEEVILPGAFDGADLSDVVFLVDHEGQPLARSRSGTMKIKADDKGLFVEAQVDSADPDGQRVLRKIERGDMDKMSFAFGKPIAQEWDESGDLPLRSISKFGRIFDVSVVTFPAYEGTEIGARGSEAARNELAQIQAARRAREASARGRLLALAEAESF